MYLEEPRCVLIRRLCAQLTHYVSVLGALAGTAAFGCRRSEIEQRFADAQQLTMQMIWEWPRPLWLSSGLKTNFRKCKHRHSLPPCARVVNVSKCLLKNEAGSLERHCSDVIFGSFLIMSQHKFGYVMLMHSGVLVSVWLVNTNPVTSTRLLALLAFLSFPAKLGYVRWLKDEISSAHLLL